MITKKGSIVLFVRRSGNECRKAANDTRNETITFKGRPVVITDKNRHFLETVLQNDANAAFEAAMLGHSHQNRIAMTA